MQRCSQIRKDYLKDKDPLKYDKMKADGVLNLHCRQRAEQTIARKSQLMNERNMADYEAEEMAISELCSRVIN